MDRAKLLDKRLRYDSAFLAYKACAVRLSEKAARNEVPASADLKAEADALATLNLARKMLLAELAKLPK